MGHGIRYMVYGMWYMVYGVQCTVYGMEHDSRLLHKDDIHKRQTNEAAVDYSHSLPCSAIYAFNSGFTKAVATKGWHVLKLYRTFREVSGDLWETCFPWGIRGKSSRETGRGA